MTDEQKKFIAKRRRAGMGYKQISNKTGISVNSIKTYCRRNNLCSKDIQPDSCSGFCEQCGKQIKSIPKKKKKRFCSDQCRNCWWNDHLGQVKKKAIYEYVCPVCGRKYSVYGDSNRKYCSHQCYIVGRFGGKHHE